ncbi:MAG: hypothetical protein AYK22_09015 [Thermoplasmatales archaeon SG8-52-3]|nr:MAG: hypothetical protein AYK22_09015 [Thermoplasmatales archaeon SG8-52-3]
MIEKINLKEMEKKAWKSCFQDGLWDILLGFILLSFGIGPFIEEITGITYLISYIILLSLGYIIFYSGKKYITLPRIGNVKFGTKRKYKKIKVAIILAISVIFGLAAILLTQIDLIPYNIDISIWGIIFAINALIVFSLMAYYLDFPRLYIYSIFFATSILIIETSSSHVGSTYDTVIGFGMFGVVVLLVGLLHLTRFVRRYPLPK